MFQPVFLCITLLGRRIYGIITSSKYWFAPTMLETSGGVTNERQFIRMNSIPQHVYKKKCTKCDKWLPFNDFASDRKSKDGMHYWCRSCCAKHRKETITPEKERKGNLRKVGCTPQMYDQMLKEQGGVCAVCKQPETRRRPWSKNGEINPLAVDHDHKTGDVRALLCSHCNTCLGKMNEDPERIRALANYAEWCRNREPSRKIIQLPLLTEHQDMDRDDDAM